MSYNVWFVRRLYLPARYFVPVYVTVERVQFYIMLLVRTAAQPVFYWSGQELKQWKAQYTSP